MRVRSRYRSLLVALLVLGVLAFSFSPARIGTVHEFRIIALLKHWRVIVPERTRPDILAADLRSNDIRICSEAARIIGLLPPDSQTILALRQYIDRRDIPIDARTVGIWALGELRVRDALPQLRTRIGDHAWDQSVLLTAIDKIEGRHSQSIWPD